MKSFSLIKDNSAISTWHQCNLKHHLRYERHREHNEQRISTTVGTATHSFMDSYFSCEEIGQAIARELEKLSALEPLAESQLAQTLFMSAANELISTYTPIRSANGTIVIFDTATKKPRWTVKYGRPELPFEIVLNEGFKHSSEHFSAIHYSHIFTGAMDCIVEDGNSHLFVAELKTSAHANNSLWRDKWRMDTQPRGYVWSVSQHTAKPIRGAIIIPIAVGKKECKMTPEIELIFTPAELEDWKNLTIESFNKIANDKDHLPTGRFNGNCINSYLGRCDFYDYCRSGYREEILIQLTNESKWSPMNRLEEKAS